MRTYKLYNETEECKVRRLCARALKLLAQIKEQEDNAQEEPEEEIFYTTAARESNVGKYCRRLADGRWLCSKE